MVKKCMELAAAGICLFTLMGCGNTEVGPGRPVAAYIGEYVTEVDITRHISGETAQWTVEGEETDALREWVSGLEYELREYEEGESPGDSDGGEVYEFIFTDGSYPGFLYVINGENDCYLLIEGYWYFVLNPSAPPVSKPEMPEPDEVVNIIDLTKNGDIGCDTALEKFHEDKTNEYFFGCIKSEYIIVEYGDGSQKPIKEAIESGDVVIEDLDKFGIHYITESAG